MGADIWYLGWPSTMPRRYQALFGYVKGGTIRDLTVKGSVKTSTKSSSYAAGDRIVRKSCNYKKLHQRGGCDGECQGMCCRCLRICDKWFEVEEFCTNKGMVSGYGDYVGGVAGTVTGSTTTITGCFNHGVVIDTGKPGSMNYCTGGIAGGISTGVTVERCGNTGNITSTLKRTGGIAGSAGGTGALLALIQERSLVFTAFAVTGDWGHLMQKSLDAIIRET